MAVFDPIRLAQWCGGEWKGDTSGVEIAGFTKDSRDVKQGQAYIALIGEKHDGHKFIQDAAEAGASCAIVSSAESDCGIPLLLVKDTLQSLQDMAREYRMEIAPHVIGVTGSSGKTTVKEMIAACLSCRGNTIATRGNWNNHVGLPMSLLELERDTETAVMEIGINHPGEMAPLCGILQPDWAVITNVGPVHLEYFESVEAIAKEKSEIVRCLPSDGIAFLDSDSKYFDVLAGAANGKVVTVSAKGNSDYTYSMSSARAVEVCERVSGEKVTVELPVPGIHIGYDAAIAVAVARARDVHFHEITAALASFEPLAMRWSVHEAGGVRLINDAYNANPMSMRASMKAFAQEECSGSRWVVLGGMLELGDVAREEHLSLGEWAVKAGYRNIVAVGDLGSWIAEGAKGSGIAVLEVARAEEAAEILGDKLTVGDSVLVKGSRGIALEKTVELLEKNLNCRN